MNKNIAKTIAKEIEFIEQCIAVNDYGIGLTGNPDYTIDDIVSSVHMVYTALILHTEEERKNLFNELDTELDFNDIERICFSIKVETVSINSIKISNNV